LKRGGPLPTELQDELVSKDHFQVQADETVSRVANKIVVESVINEVAYGLTVNRNDPGFTERERAMLNVLHPHLHY